MQDHDPIVFAIFAIFTGAAVLATFALYLRQAMLIAYLVLGVLFGPWGFGLIEDAAIVQEISHIGIIFLLFLLGLNLLPEKLIGHFGATAWMALVSTAVFGGFAFGIAFVFGYRGYDLLLIGICATFSSTIIGLKLLPTTVLHHQHMGEIMISVLLLQDLIALASMIVMNGLSTGEVDVRELVVRLIALPLIFGVAWLGQKRILMPLFMKYDRIQEYVFLVTIGWCLGLAELAYLFGLSHEIGAFAAGIAIAGSPVSLHIAESLKPLRDFFLVMFFFAIGASFDISSVPQVWAAALLIGGGLMLVKPLTFKALLHGRMKEHHMLEAGVRLGQMSEFSLLLAAIAVQNQLVTLKASYLVQFATVITFVISTYWIVLKYPTPIAVNEELRRD